MTQQGARKEEKLSEHTGRAPSVLHVGRRGGTEPTAKEGRSGDLEQHLYVLVVALTAVLFLNYPLVDSRISIGVSSFEILIWLTFPFAALLNLLPQQRYKALRPIHLMPEIHAYMLWCALAAIASLTLRDSFTSVGIYKTMLPGYMLFFMLVWFVRSTKQLRTVIYVMLFCVWIHAILGILQFFTGSFYFIAPQADTGKIDMIGEALKHMPIGLTTTPNNLGGVLIPGLVIAVRLLLEPSVRREMPTGLLLMVFLLTASVALYLTFARAAMLCAMVGVFFAVVPLRSYRVVIGIAAVVGCVAAVSLASYLTQDISAPVDPSNMVARIRLWQAALEAFQNDAYVLLFGDGTEGVGYYSTGLDFKHAHNAWLDQIVNFGVVALALYAIMWVRCLSYANAAATGKRGSLVSLGDALFASLLALAGEWFFEPASNGVSFVGRLMFYFGLAVVAGRIAQREAAAQSKNSKRGSRRKRRRPTPDSGGAAPTQYSRLSMREETGWTGDVDAHRHPSR